MVRFLAYVAAVPGRLYPLVPTLLELTRRGHRVVVKAGVDDVGRLRAAGLDARSLAPPIARFAPDDWRARTRFGALMSELRQFGARAPAQAADLAAAIDAERPDVLFVDEGSWGAAAVAEASGLPWAFSIVSAVPLTSHDAPPFGLGLRPRGRARATPRSGSSTPARAGRARSTSWDRGCGNPPPTRPRGSPTYADRSSWSPARPCFQNDRLLAEVAGRAFAGQPLDIVITTGEIDPASVAASGNVRVERCVPHAPVLDRAVCAVCHAGMGIAQKALAHGVPVVAIPFGRDQPEVGRRVEVARAGVRLPVRRLSAEHLRAADAVEHLAAPEAACRCWRP